MIINVTQRGIKSCLLFICQAVSQDFNKHCSFCAKKYHSKCRLMGRRSSVVRQNRAAVKVT